MVWCGVMRYAGSLRERYVYIVVCNVVVLNKSRVVQLLRCTAKRGVRIGFCDKKVIYVMEQML